MRSAVGQVQTGDTRALGTVCLHSRDCTALSFPFPALSVHSVFPVWRPSNPRLSAAAIDVCVCVCVCWTAGCSRFSCVLPPPRRSFRCLRSPLVHCDVAVMGWCPTRPRRVQASPTPANPGGASTCHSSFKVLQRPPASGCHCRRRCGCQRRCTCRGGTGNDSTTRGTAGRGAQGHGQAAGPYFPLPACRHPGRCRPRGAGAGGC